MAILEGTTARIMQHCAVFGQLETPVRTFTVSDVRPYAQYPVSVTVRFQKPRERRSSAFTMTPDNTRYLVIEVDGAQVFDSRDYVPCDMDKWEATWQRFKGRPPLVTVHQA
jgi:hypothetical protein